MGLELLDCLFESIHKGLLQHTAHLWLLLTGVTDVRYRNPAVNITSLPYFSNHGEWFGVYLVLLPMEKHLIC